MTPPRASFDTIAKQCILRAQDRHEHVGYVLSAGTEVLQLQDESLAQREKKWYQRVWEDGDEQVVRLIIHCSSSTESWETHSQAAYGLRMGCRRLHGLERMSEVRWTQQYVCRASDAGAQTAVQEVSQGSDEEQAREEA